MVDLGKSPLCESFLPADRLEAMEPFYPLHVRVCTRCWLAQLPAFVTPDEIFHEYAYFSAYSDSWVEHARAYVEMIASRLSLTSESLVVELASNDGYLLQHFLPKGISGARDRSGRERRAGRRGARCPDARRVLRRRARASGWPREGRQADLVIGNNVLAQVPDLNDFVAGVSILLAPGGTATFEFPHLARLLEGLQYDTIYHEHFSYFSLATIREVFAAHGLAVVDVEELASHGGSLRVYAAHASEGREPRAGGRESSSRARRPKGCATRSATGASPTRWRSRSGRCSIC